VYFQSQIDASTVVYNDKNIHLANLFSVMNNDRENFIDSLISLTPQDRDIFNQCKDYIFEPGYKDSVLWASSFIYCQTQIFAGNTLLPKTNMTHLKGKYRSKYEQFIDKLTLSKYSLYMEKLDRISFVENLDVFDLMDKYDSEDTLFYIDPPYIDLEHYYTESDFLNHKELVERLMTLKGSFVLSYYDHELLNPLKEICMVRTKEFSRQSSTRTNSRGTEILFIKG
jgi:DNA adenine methylase